MPSDAKSARWTRQYSTRAPAELIHTAAFATVKMVVMRLACHLVTGGLSRQRNRFKPALLQQRLDIAIHRRDTQRLVVMLARDKSLFRGERPIRLDKGIANGLLLTRIAWDGLRHVC